MRGIASPLLAPLAATALLAGCVSGQDATNGALRFMNAVPDAPRMNLQINDRTRASGYDFRTGSAYIAIVGGTYTVSVDAVDPDGEDEDSAVDLREIFTGSIPLRVNDEMTLVLLGSNDSPETVQIATRTRAVPIGTTRVQFVHAAAGGPAFDVYVTEPDATVDVSTPAFASGLDYKAYTGQQDIEGGSRQVIVTAAGNPQAVLFDSGTIFFSLEATLLVAIVPSVGFDAVEHPYSLVFMTGAGTSAVIDAGSQTSLRLVNASQGSYTLDAFVNETSVDNTARQVCDPLSTEEDTLLEACALPYMYIGPFEVLEPGSYDLKVQVTGDAELLARTTTGNFLAGAQATLMFTGLIGEEATDTAVGLQTINSTRRIASAAQLRIVDRSIAVDEAIEGDPTTDRIELYITDVGAPLEDENPDFFGLRAGSDTGYISLLPKSYQLTVARSDTATPEVPPEVLLTQEVTLDGGGIYTLIIADSVGGVAPISFLSLDDDPTP